MNTKGRKLLKCVAAAMTAVVLMGAAYESTAMADGIGLIDTADLLDIHADADGASEVVGQVVDEGHVMILGRSGDWVQIQAGDILGWVPAANLIETEVSSEEAVEANEQIIAELTEDAEEVRSEEEEEENIEEAQGAAPEEGAQEQDGPAEAQADAQGDAGAQDRTGAQSAAQEEQSGQAEQSGQSGQAEQFARQQEQQAQAQSLQAEQQAQEAARQQEALAALEAELARVQKAQQEAQAQQEALALQEALAQQAAQALQEQQAGAEAAGISQEDVKLLANIIYCEAGGEPYIGKVAVGSVVMNRVRSSRHPNTISEVIYAKGQFSPVRSGKLQKALDADKADASCYQAALEALAGSQPVGDKLYFRRVNGRAGQVIGHHVFY